MAKEVEPLWGLVSAMARRPLVAWLGADSGGGDVGDRTSQEAQRVTSSGGGDPVTQAQQQGTDKRW